MKILVNGLKSAELIKDIKKNYPSLKIVKQNPDLVISYGGDGTLLLSERLYPGLPKVMLRRSQVCRPCSDHSKKQILALLEKEEFSLTEKIKLEAQVKGKKITALNDIAIMHVHYNKALRFKVCIDGQCYGTEYLGDGVIVSTPLGSTGYYQSITHCNFYDGLGLAFNNVINLVSHLVLKSDSEIKIQITRGPGIVVNDNNDKFLPIDTGDSVLIKKAPTPARLVTFKNKQLNIDLAQQRYPLGFCQVCRQPI